MTGSVARPYNKEVSRMPVFSGVRQDLLFRKGDVIEIFAFPKSRPVNCIWSVSHNMVEFPLMRGKGELAFDHSVRMVIPSGKLAPGFYDLKFSIDITAGQYENGQTTFGYGVDEIKITDSMPADFTEFWQNAKAELDEIPLNTKTTFVRKMTDEEVTRYNLEHANHPGDYDPEGKKCKKIEVYKMHFDSAGGKTIHGWLTMPVGKGPFPGLLALPGAGIVQIPMHVEGARHGYATFSIQIHGHDVDMKKYPSIRKYNIYGLSGYGKTLTDDYFYNVFLACVQAVRCLGAHSKVDASHLAVAGGSQGGLLALVAAALSPEIKAAVSSLTYYAYFPFRDHITAINKKKSSGGKRINPPFDPEHKRQRHMSYYDAMNFAAAVKVPVLIGACMSDFPSPVTTVLAVHRKLKHPGSEICFSPNTNHDFVIAFERKAWRWLANRLKIKHGSK